jgi:hypothetical protein
MKEERSLPKEEGEVPQSDLYLDANQDPFIKYPHLAALKREAETGTLNSAKYWELRCRYLEKTIDETYSISERDNCRRLYLILQKRNP